MEALAKPAVSALPFEDEIYGCTAECFTESKIRLLLYGERKEATEYLFDKFAQFAVSQQWSRVQRMGDALLAFALIWAAHAEGLPLLQWLLSLPWHFLPLFHQAARSQRVYTNAQRKRGHKSLASAICTAAHADTVIWFFQLPSTAALAEKGRGKLKAAFALLIQHAPLDLIVQVRSLLPARVKLTIAQLGQHLARRMEDCASESARYDAASIFDWLLDTFAECVDAHWEHGTCMLSLAVDVCNPDDPPSITIARMERVLSLVSPFSVVEEDDLIAERLVRANNKPITTYWLSRSRPDAVPWPCPGTGNSGCEPLVATLPKKEVQGDLACVALASCTVEYIEWYYATFGIHTPPGNSHPINDVLCTVHVPQVVSWALHTLPGAGDAVTLSALRCLRPMPMSVHKLLVGVTSPRIALGEYAHTILALSLRSADLALTDSIDYPFLQLLFDNFMPDGSLHTARIKAACVLLKDVATNAASACHSELVPFLAQKVQEIYAAIHCFRGAATALDTKTEDDVAGQESHVSRKRVRIVDADDD